MPPGTWLNLREALAATRRDVEEATAGDQGSLLQVIELSEVVGRALASDSAPLEEPDARVAC